MRQTREIITLSCPQWPCKKIVSMSKKFFFNTYFLTSILMCVNNMCGCINNADFELGLHRNLKNLIVVKIMTLLKHW